MMHGFENSLTTAHAIQSGLTDTLQVGLGQLTREDNILIQNLKKTKDKLPGLEIIVEYNDMASLLDTLVNGNGRFDCNIQTFAAGCGKISSGMADNRRKQPHGLYACRSSSGLQGKGPV